MSTRGTPGRHCEGGLPLDRILELAVPLSDAIAAAHDRGIVHRDLKPRNIMITEEGRLKILDFGLAAPAEGKPVAESTQVPTASLADHVGISGTVPYMSPEQIRGGPLDARSDLFSVGVILPEMATGRRPFTGPTPADVIAAILKETPAPVTEDNPEQPAALSQLILICLEKDPEHRLQSARDLRNQLRWVIMSIGMGN